MKNKRGHGSDQRVSFWKHSDRVPTGCWVWRGGKSKKGQGVTRFRGKNWGTARVAWTLTYGAIPTGRWVLHACDNPSCINPAHLFLGDAQSNVDDMCQKGRHWHGRRPVCHPERRHMGKGLCDRCYMRQYAKTHHNAICAYKRLWARAHRDGRPA